MSGPGHCDRGRFACLAGKVIMIMLKSLWGYGPSTFKMAKLFVYRGNLAILNLDAWDAGALSPIGCFAATAIAFRGYFEEDDEIRRPSGLCCRAAMYPTRTGCLVRGRTGPYHPHLSRPPVLLAHGAGPPWQPAPLPAFSTSALQGRISPSGHKPFWHSQ